MNNVELINTFAECFENLLQNKFPIPFADIDTQIHLTHKTGYFGICRKKLVKGRYVYTIGINANFAANGTKKAITNTIYHELLHTISIRHDKVWKMYAKRVYELFGYNVCRCGGDKTAHDINCL
jgi:hypothetical protein